MQVPEADDAACERYYRQQSQRFTSGDMVEARHILFQTVPMGGEGNAGVKVQNIVESDAPGRRVASARS